MQRLAFLGWAANSLGINHTGARPYVCRQIRGLSMGIDAEGYGVMRVHLFALDAPLVAWLGSIPSSKGPLSMIAEPVFHQRTSSPRRYYGFTWKHANFADYADEQPTVTSFVNWLRPIARQQGATF